MAAECVGPQHLLDMILQPSGRHVVFMMTDHGVDEIEKEKEKDREFEREFWAEKRRKRLANPPKYMVPENLVCPIKGTILEQPIPPKKKK